MAYGMWMNGVIYIYIYTFTLTAVKWSCKVCDLAPSIIEFSSALEGSEVCKLLEGRMNVPVIISYQSPTPGTVC